MKNIAIIPMRKGSTRLKNKNFKDFFGKPIFLYTLEYAKKCGLFDEIFISTDSLEIKKISEENGFQCPYLRPDELASDNAQLNEVIKYTLDFLTSKGKNFDNICMLWGTAPMRTDKDIANGYEMLIADDAEAVVGITEYYQPVLCAMSIEKEGWLKPLFPEQQMLPSSQMPVTVVDNSAFCWIKTEAFHRHGTWLPPKIKGYMMPVYYSTDIDTAADWALAEFNYEHFFLKDNSS